MRDGRASLGLALAGALGIALCLAGPATAQEWSGNEGSTTAGPSLDDYLKEAGPDAKVIAHGALKLDGKSVNCGKRPTVLTTNFDSWGGAFPGFLILNTKKINGLSTQVKLYIYSHECGHQFIGADETRSRPFRHQARREMGLARCARHGGHLHLHLAVERRRGASARPATLRDHAQILS